MLLEMRFVSRHCVKNLCGQDGSEDVRSEQVIEQAAWWRKQEGVQMWRWQPISLLC